jgi:hypothetical protein
LGEGDPLPAHPSALLAGSDVVASIGDPRLSRPAIVGASDGGGGWSIAAAYSGSQRPGVAALAGSDGRVL